MSEKRPRVSYQKFSEIIKLGKISTYLYLERYWNDGSPSGYNLNISGRYSPSSSHANFPLPVYAVDQFACTHIGELSYHWSTEILNLGKLPIPLHPRTYENIKRKYGDFPDQPHKNIDVVPLANGRTVFHLDNGERPHFIKLHYPEIIGRIPRGLPLFKWISGLENSRELISHIHDFPSSLCFLPEPAGTFFQSTKASPGFGVLYRDFVPVPERKSCLLLPAFSLFAQKELEHDTDPLLIQILNDFSPTIENFIDKFITPALSAFVFLSCEIGLIPELHAQNSLYEINLADGSTRFVIRDLSDIFKDFTLRRHIGLHNTFCSYKTINIDRDVDYYKRRSFSYDFKLGEYLLHPLARCFSKGMKIPLHDVIGAILEEAKSIWLKHPDYFLHTDKWYAYPKEDRVSRDSYIEYETPNFR